MYQGNFPEAFVTLQYLQSEFYDTMNIYIYMRVRSVKFFGSVNGQYEQTERRNNNKPIKNQIKIKNLIKNLCTN